MLQLHFFVRDMVIPMTHILLPRIRMTCPPPLVQTAAFIVFVIMLCVIGGIFVAAEAELRARITILIRILVMP